MSRRLGWLFALTIVACGSSPPGGARPDQRGATGPVVGPTAATPPSWGDTLRGENLADMLVDFVQGRAVPSNFSSLAQGPELALGSVYVIKARPGKTCASTSAADYEDARLPDFRLRTPACVVKVFPKAQRKDQTVRGSVRGGLQFIVGGSQVSADAVYQLSFEDTQAVFESTSDCIDLERLAKARLPERTCAAKYISGAVLTTITWRDFQKADAAVTGSYTSLVKVGLDIYGSTSGMTMTPVLSFDTIDLEAFRLVTTGPDGFLQVAPPTKAIAFDDIRHAIALGDDAFRALARGDDPRWSQLFGPGATYAVKLDGVADE